MNFKMFLPEFARFLASIAKFKRTRTIRRRRRKFGRNEPCHCGAMKDTFIIDKHGNEVPEPVKYKFCHWAQDVFRGAR
jgi:hypothetical protein